MHRLPRRFVMLACALLALAAYLPVTAAPAAAVSTTLCTGYAGCSRLGMGNDGYDVQGRSMWWLMYSGHNCTNYAAYRMVRSGMPNQRPWSGGGNATYWGTSNAALTNDTPRVGAVAWWRAYAPPAGSAGHVAYVEQVVSPDEIIVSQDSWGGEFTWARITRTSGRWPSGFVHFNDVRLENTTAPGVAGRAKVGEVLAASTGVWTHEPATYTYQWRANGVAIPGATAASLVPTTAEQGKRISVRVTASRLGYGRTTALSASTAPLASGALTNDVPPTVTGEPTVDSSLAVDPGTWSPDPSSLSYQWLADGAPIAGATSGTFVPTADLVGRSLSVAVTAAKAGYADVSVRAGTAGPVTPAAITVTSGPSIEGTPRLGGTLTIVPAQYAPGDAHVSVRWLRAGVPIPGATGSSYRLTAADLGSRIAVRTRVTKPGYTSLRLRAPATTRVRTASAIVLEATGGPGRATFAVTVTAPAVPVVAGTVRVTSAGELLGEATLQGGSATLTVRDLSAGRHSFRVHFSATTTVAGSSLRRSVPIL